jgi:hypothetical protein
MLVNQIHNILNEITNEVLGEESLVQEDLSNIVEVGEQVFNTSGIDNYVKSLINHIGRVVFVNRPYNSSAPSVLMDSWEFGSVLEKITSALPEATENETWELVDGQSYDPNVFYKPDVSAKFYNGLTTFEIPMSFTEKQVKESFSDAAQLNAFMSMIENSIYKSMTVKTDSLIMRTINNMIGETLYDAVPSGAYGNSSGVRAVNLLYLYNQKYPNATLTAASAFTNPDFIRFAAYTMGVYQYRMSKISNLFNIGGTDKFTTSDFLHFVMLSDFAMGADVYLQSDTFHDEFTRLPNAERVPYWQGSGTNYGLDSISSINIKTSNNHEVNASGILAVMFDRDALGVNNYDRRVTTYYNPKAEFFNNWYKQDARYFNDSNENFVVFYIADTSN